MDILIALFSSKKFIAAVVGTIVAIGARYGLHLDPVDIALILSPLVSFIIGQGVADLGKDAARISAVADSAKQPIPEATAAVGRMAKGVKRDS